MLLWPVMFVVVDVFLLISVAALAIAQASQVARNVTTNELANWHRCNVCYVCAVLGVRGGVGQRAGLGCWTALLPYSLTTCAPVCPPLRSPLNTPSTTSYCRQVPLPAGI